MTDEPTTAGVDWPDESDDPPAFDVPVGDRAFVPPALLQLDGTTVTVVTKDENGHPNFSRAALRVDPAMFREAARRRGEVT